MYEGGHVMTDSNLDAVIAFKKKVMAEGKRCTQVQCKSTLEALLDHLKGE